MDGVYTDSFEALQQEHDGKTAASDLVLDIEFVVFDANGGEPFREIAIAQVFAS